MNYINLYYLVDYTLYLFLAFSQCSTSTPNAFDGHTEFLWVFNFTILSYSWNLQKKLMHVKDICFTVKTMMVMMMMITMMMTLLILAVVVEGSLVPFMHETGPEGYYIVSN